MIAFLKKLFIRKPNPNPLNQPVIPITKVNGRNVILFQDALPEYGVMVNLYFEGLTEPRIGKRTRDLRKCDPKQNHGVGVIEMWHICFDPDSKEFSERCQPAMVGWTPINS